MMDSFDDLPTAIPPHVRSGAAILKGDAGDVVVWPHAAARALVHALKGSTIALESGEVYRLTADRPEAVNAWLCERTPNESAIDFATRSRELAASYLAVHRDGPDGSFVFAFDFDSQNAAA